MSTSNVYCIIVTYNAMKWVDRCLGSLRQSKTPCVPVVIDNLSKDETVSYIGRHFPEAHLIVNNVNQGFGQANNQGLEWAYKQGGSHFFLLNQDAWIYPDTLSRLVEVQDRYNIPLVSPIHLNGSGEKMDVNFYDCCVLQNSSIGMVSDIILGKTGDQYPIKYVNAAAWMMSRELLEKIGGFDPLFFHYGEDVQYCYRMAYHTMKMSVVPLALVNHDREQFGNIKVYKKNETFRTLVIRKNNINHSFIYVDKSKLAQDIVLISGLFRFFFTLRWGKLLSSLAEIGRYYAKWPAIIRSRQANKKVGSNWLNLENTNI